MSKSPMSNRLGRCRIVGFDTRVGGQHKLNGTHHIVYMNPAQPLLAITQPGFHVNPKRLGHLAQCAALTSQHHTEAQQDTSTASASPAAPLPHLDKGRPQNLCRAVPAR